MLTVPWSILCFPVFSSELAASGEYRNQNMYQYLFLGFLAVNMP